MQKLKFQIKGMHCNSCALLIEERLKSHPGIIKAKTSYDSQKTVVIYDEQKIQESEIVQIIKEAGDFQAEKIEEKEEEKEKIIKEEPLRVSEEKHNFFRPNLLIPISIIIAGLIIAGAIIVSGGNVNIGKEITSAKQTAQILPSQNDSVVQQPPSADGSASIQTFEINIDDHVRGNFSVPITLVEFSDFECPFCERIYPTLNKILSDYQGKVRLVYKHFPLGFHPNAQKAAEASECADEQGKFWEYHDKLFENLDIGYSPEKFKQWAKDLGLNSGKFNDCLDSSKYTQKIQADYQEGTEKGVNGTPATFVNGQLVSGALPYESFKQIIDDLLSQ